MKTIKLHLDSIEPEYNFIYIMVNDKDMNKAVKVIEKANNNMPNIRVIQDKYLLDNELDFCLYMLDKNKIKYEVVKYDIMLNIRESY